MTGTKKPPASEVAVVMVPFVMQGHLNQLLHLSRLISAYNIPVHFVSTTTHIRQLKARDPLSDTSHLIHFHQFPTPPFPSPSPHPSIPFPSHLQPALDSALHLRRPVAHLVLSLSQTARRIAVVHDSLMSYVVQDVKSIPNAEAYIFRPLSAFYIFFKDWERLGKPFPVEPDCFDRLPSHDGTFTPEFLAFAKLQHPYKSFQAGELFDSSRAVEGKFLEYLEREEMSRKTNKVWAFGPFNPVEIVPNQNPHKCVQWLDMQAPDSVIYVSFGTTTTFTQEQVTELAVGLERSQQRFVWVVRAADKGDVCGGEDGVVELPNGFEERVEGRGLVVREWAPQTEILGHSATGGFMSHCGWNSSMESISMGVPMATWPMHSDQPRNAFLITDVLGIGLAVKDWARREELVTRVVVEKAVRTLMDSRKGEEIRRRAAELGGAVKRSMAKDGEGRKEMDSFMSYISR